MATHRAWPDSRSRLPFKRPARPDLSLSSASQAAPADRCTLIKALARAWRWQKLFDEGVYTSVSEIGDAENIAKSYVSRPATRAAGAGHRRGDPRGADGSGADA